MVVSPPDPDAASYDAAFRAWLAGIIARHAAAKPRQPPYPAERFDGCSGVPDTARHCCACHDVAYWHAETPAERLEADRGLRDCIIAAGRGEERVWRPLWWLLGWLVFLGVRAFGRPFAGKGARAAVDRRPLPRAVPTRRNRS